MANLTSTSVTVRLLDGQVVYSGPMPHGHQYVYSSRGPIAPGELGRSRTCLVCGEMLTWALDTVWHNGQPMQVGGIA